MALALLSLTQTSPNPGPGCTRPPTSKHAILTGVGLIERKQRLGHGNWLPWVEASFDGDRTTAFRYMKAAEQYLSNVAPLQHLEPPKQVGATVTEPEADDIPDAEVVDGEFVPDESNDVSLPPASLLNPHLHAPRREHMATTVWRPDLLPLVTDLAPVSNRLTVYHGTSATHVKSIRTQGIVADRDSGGPFVTTTDYYARAYAIYAAVRAGKANGVIFTCNVNRAGLDRDATDDFGVFIARDGIKPDDIIDMEVIDVEQADARADVARCLGCIFAHGSPASLDDTQTTLITHALLTATNPPERSVVHGSAHWKSVARNGLDLADQTPDSDREFVLTFAQLHDLMRESDGPDPEHGQRAAALYRTLVAQGAVELRPELDNSMAFALANHNTMDHPPADSNVNVGICWDADRLDLWRVGIIPDPALMTTDAARSYAVRSRSITRSYEATLGRQPTWSEITNGIG